MAKITRKHQKIFAGDVSATNVVAQFGSFKASSPNYSSDPDTIQNLAAWGEGWASAVVSNYAPPLQDLNALFFVLSRQIAYLMQNGIPYWNASATYYIGSLVSDDAGTVYMSVVDDNTNQALTDGTKWLNLISSNVTTVSTLNYTVLNSDSYIRVTANGGSTDKYVDLPAPASTNKGRIVIVKMLGSTAVSQLGVRASGGSTIDGGSAVWMSQNAKTTFISNGTNWETI